MKHISKSHSHCSFRNKWFGIKFQWNTEYVLLSSSLASAWSPSFQSSDWGSSGWCLASQTQWWRMSGRVELLCAPASSQAETKTLEIYFFFLFPEKCPNKLWPYFHPGATLHSWSAAWPHQRDHPQWRRGVGSSPWYGSCKQKCTDSSGNICQPLRFEHCFNISIEVWQL